MIEGPERRRNSLLACLAFLRQCAPRITVSEMLVFLYVAENGGIRVKELSELMGTTPATASRAARALVSPGDLGALPPGLGWLVMASNEREKISRHLYLTPSGVEVAQRLDTLLGRARLIGVVAAPTLRSV
ncbi:MAG: MarR family transcriptional regulator [Alphaproteobacteria bacterium]|nr:MarR family transcriptional regulator [Alphaproteobacteria bacterium]MBU2040578.1 MarR family transcriptional regulator [Alphaproteobacteria bacterium]MBU2125233.1 MarR family transcriptional regulator [Alphaproteobacteria bacterium]MBU2209975.1 MarR family transcriptional regulator [Alphaproteobacteria bacterium]MBU2290671.1 MarR family transcriptional regulator [Alphaproteobacteria bacterium]